MIDIKNLENKGEDENYFNQYQESLIARKGDSRILQLILDKSKERKAALAIFEEKKSELNKTSDEIAKIKRAGGDAAPLLEAMQALSKKIKDLEMISEAKELELNDLLLQIPNKLHASVPVGKNEEDNKIIKEVGVKNSFSFKPLTHDELAEKLNLIDFTRAAKVTGARFNFLLGSAARLERALVQFMMDLHADQHGYTEMIPPFVVNAKSLVGTGQFPKFKDDVFGLSGTDYYLIPTAEVPVTNFFRDEILKEENLPQKYVAYSPCFRSEAGSHGKDTKGLIRQHQFNKIELMIYSIPEQSYELHELLTEHAEKVLDLLELPYRRSLLCSGDIGFGAAKCFDIEVWLPGQNSYREISSCSNFEDFQARRAGIRYRPKGNGKPRFVHTLNGSGLAVGRTLLAIFENYQTEQGTIKIPKVLKPYMGNLEEIK